MSKAKHTPGPWYWLSDNYLESEAVGGGTVLECGDDGAPWGMHSAVLKHHHDEEVAAANKRLIAAAPELLEAAQEALIELYRISPSVAAPKLRAAIAKATGA